jgi:hypothetical protein
MERDRFNRLANSLVSFTTGGKLQLEVNPEFTELDNSFKHRRTIYDVATLLIVDDKNKKLVPRFRVKRQSS